MKKSVLALAIISISFSTASIGSSWFSSAKSMVGIDDNASKTEEVKTTTSEKTATATEALSSAGLVDMLTSSLNVNDDQAEGGMGALLNFAKSNLSMDQFTSLSDALPGTDSLIDKMPTLGESDSTSGLGGLLNTASQYSDSLQSINALKEQFEALGLDPSMIAEYISTAQSYLDTPAGAEAKKWFTEGVSKLMAS